MSVDPQIDYCRMKHTNQNITFFINYIVKRQQHREVQTIPWVSTI